jgi:carbon monoxide dehydrogenase subunit G
MDGIHSGGTVRFSGSETFIAPRSRVWHVLVDLSNVSGCVSAPIVRLDDTHFRSEPKVGSGLFSATFVLETEVSQLDPERRATAVTHGKASGMTLDAVATIDLRDGETPGSTVADWACNLEFGGGLAGPGTRRCWLRVGRRELSFGRHSAGTLTGQGPVGRCAADRIGPRLRPT